jgi:hypothetical protein
LRADDRQLSPVGPDSPQSLKWPPAVGPYYEISSCVCLPTERRQISFIYLDIM